MSNLKRFAKLNEMTTVTPPVQARELTSRQTDYLLLSPKQFATKYRDVLFRPVRFTFDGQDFDIQVNGCTNPFCKWFGLPQKRFEDVKNKPSRYRISGSDSSVACNPDPTGLRIVMAWSDYSGSISNWSVAYTAIAHFWLIRNMLKSKEWRFISDADSSLTQSLYRVFAPEIVVQKLTIFCVSWSLVSPENKRIESTLKHAKI